MKLRKFKRNTKDAKKKKQGISLLAVIVTIVFLTLVGFVGLSMLSTGTRKSVDYLYSEKAFYIAEAGVEVALRKLQDNWDNWKTSSNFPNGSLAGGTFSLSVYDDDDGDNNPDTDSNNCVIIESTGEYQQARRRIKVYVDRSGLPDAAIYSNNNVDVKSNSADVTGNVVANTINDPHNRISGEKETGNTFLPTLDLAWFRAQAEANTLNGNKGSPGNYFPGEFKTNLPSLNGVIYIDTYVSGNNKHKVTISGNIITESGEGNPAVLIINGDLNLKGTGAGLKFNGLIYVTGEVEADSDIGGNVEISGMVISNGALDIAGNAVIGYNADSIPGSVRNHLYGTPRMFNFKEIASIP
ncbi:MAG: FapA family protein [Candidatus Omnitrophica bacterium]|nr:FapA family protein [Candidatus Omnitrophota bacterium]